MNPENMLDPRDQHYTEVEPMSVVHPNQPRIQLRRAVYVHVSDLTSAYNIDHVKLEEELTRVNEELHNLEQENLVVRSNLGGVPTELDTSYKKRLQPPRGGNNMVVLVGKVRIVVDKNRVDGSRVRLAEVEVGDETGTVSLRARDDQIDVLREISDRVGSVVLRNCTLELYQGKHMRLAVTKWGKLSAYPDQVPSTPPPPSKINRERNFSLINLSIVASEMLQKQQTDHMSSDMDSLTQQGSTSISGRSFQSNQSRRGRRPMRGKPNPGPSLPIRSYADTSSSAMRTFQESNLQHAYSGGFVDGSTGAPQYYAPRQQDASQRQQHHQQQQQFMFHHQMAMQQRQMQMYQGNVAQNNRMHTSMQQSSPMHGPPSTCFGTGYGGSVRSEMPPSPTHPHMMPIPSTAATSPSRFSESSRPDSPEKMNPQAATFDPHSTKFQQY